MKKNKTVLLFGFLIYFLASTPVSAISLDLVPSSSTVTAGESIFVDVVVSGLAAADQAITTYDLFINYDSAILAATGTTFGTNLEDFFDFSLQGNDLETAGTANVSEVSLLSDETLFQIQPDSFSLVTIAFDAIAEGMTELTFGFGSFFDFVDLKGSMARVLPVDAGSARVTVIAAVEVPEPGSFALLLPGLLLFAALRIKRKLP